MVLIEAEFEPLETVYPRLPTRESLLLPPKRRPRRGHVPTVIPGTSKTGSVVWRAPRTPSLADSRAGLRADVSAIHDFDLVRQHIERQQPPPSAPPKLPPKLASSASLRIAQLAGLEPTDVLASRVATPALSGRRSAPRGLSRGSASTGALDVPLKFRAFPTKPSNRSEVVQLEAVLEAKLAGASGDLQAEMGAWDEAFGELCRQVSVHCAERGALLERVRAQHGEWIVRLSLAVGELGDAKSKMTAEQREEATTQEERLQELLLANKSMVHKMSLLKRELEWNKKAAMVKSEFDASTSWQGLKHTLAFINGATRDHEGGTAVFAEGTAMGVEQRVLTIKSLFSDLSGEVSVEEFVELIQSSLASLQGSEQLEMMNSLCGQLSAGLQCALAADLLTSLRPQDLKEVVEELAADDKGAAALASLHRLASRPVSERYSPEEAREAAESLLGRCGPRAREAALKGMAASLSNEERCNMFGPHAWGVSAPKAAPPVERVEEERDAEGMTAAERAEEAREYRLALAARSSRRAAADALAEAEEAEEGDEDGGDGGDGDGEGGDTAADGGAEKPGSRPPRRESLRSPEVANANRRLSAVAVGGEFGPVEAEAEAEEGSGIESAIGAVGVAEILSRKRGATKALSRPQLLKLIAGATAMAVEAYAEDYASARPRAHFRDELWRYLVTQTSRRSEAVASLTNIATALEAQAKEPPQVSNGGARVSAFRHLCGIAPSAGGVWPAHQAGFYLMALQAILMSAAGGATEGGQAKVFEAGLATESLHISVGQAAYAIKVLIADETLRLRLTARVKGAAEEEEACGNSASAAVDVDWLLSVLMQAWEDNQLAAQESLQQLFLRSDANGDGILQLDEFSAMLKTHRPEISEGEAFRLYDETMALSERMLGYETDAILADAFVRTAVSHQLFPNLGSAFRSHETPLPNPYLERGRAARSPSPPHAGGALPAAAGQSAKGGGADSRLAARARHDSPMRIALASARAGGGPGSPGAGPRSPSPGSPSAPAAGAAASGALRRPSGLSGVQVVSIAGAVPQSLSDHGVQQVPSPAASRSYVLSAPRHEVAPLPRLHEARWPSTERRAEARAKA